jgi:hypothetical protein
LRNGIAATVDVPWLTLISNWKQTLPSICILYRQRGSLVDYRNPNPAEALRVLGFVQRFGFGIPAARWELEKNGKAPLSF